MKVAALDMGSNTTLMLICEVADSKILHVYSDHSTVTRLGQNLDKSGHLHAEALQRMDQCLRLYRDIIDQENVEKVVAVATSAARDASNKEELYAITEKYNIPVKIIPGHEEADVTFMGSTFDLESTEGVAVVDVGGGSTEIIAKVNGQIVGHSLDIGSVRLTERFITSHPVSQSELKKLDDFLEKQLSEHQSKLPASMNITKVIAVAGTPTTLAMVQQKIEFDDEKVHGFQMSHLDLAHWRNKLARMTINEREKLKGMNPKRADVIVTGASILKSVLNYLNQPQIIVSTKGVRYGLALRHDF